MSTTTTDAQASLTCHCPACRGLECLERPRFFTGQLLTEAELNGEQSYLLAKNRLHNRYLHGSGVVCGLAVVCDDCSGYVVVRQGYALDPCGNDVIVCEDRRFDLIGAIAACREAERRPPGDCDPLLPPVDAACKDVEEHWCITLRYVEQETRELRSLRYENGNGSANGHSGCGCGCTPSSASAPAGARGIPVGCEPTRIRETYALGVVREQPKQKDGFKLEPGPLKQALDACHEQAADVLALFPAVDSSTTPARMYQEACAFYQAVHAYLAATPKTRCSVGSELAALQPVPPQQGATLAAYNDIVGPQLVALKQLVGIQALDCICLAMLPSCPPLPADERLVLACVTVKDGKIVKICNAEGRTQVVGFPTLAYVLPGLPVGMLLLLGAALLGGGYDEVLELLCCEHEEFLGLLVPKDTKKNPKTGAPVASQKSSVGNLGALATNLVGVPVAQALLPQDLMLLDTKELVGQPLAAVSGDLKERGVEPRTVDVSHWPARERARVAASTPAAVAGHEPLVLYTSGRKVVGAGVLDETEHLREQVNDLETRLRSLERKRG